MSDEILIELQKRRKNNLNKIVEHEFNGSVEEFANSLEKNKFFIYGLLWGVEKRASRNITDKTARLIERHLRLPSGYLDEENPIIDPSVTAIPFVSINISESNNDLSFSEEPGFSISKLELVNNKIDPNTLVALRMPDESMNQYFGVNDIVIIDRSKTEFISNRIYLIQIGQNFLVRSLARSLATNKIEVIPTNNVTNSMFKTFEMDGLSKIKIFGTCVLSINYFKGL